MSIEPNYIYHCDCLSLLERLENNKVALVYLDPPWFSGNDFLSAFDNKNYKLLNHPTINKNDDDSFISYLDFISIVLQQSRRVLSDDGNLFFHVDPSISGYIRIMVDDYFGRGNFRSEIILPTKRRLSKSRFFPEHTSILFYGKSDKSIFNPPKRALSESEIKERYIFSDGGKPYRLVDLTTSVERKSHIYYLKGSLPPTGRSWRYSKEKMEQFEKEGLLHHGAENRPPFLKLYLDKDSVVEVGNIWDDISPLPSKYENNVFPSQQSIALLERVILFGSNEGSTVVDPFLGSGTTLLAAHKLKRGWIGCDVSPQAYKISVERLERGGLAKGIDFNFGDMNDLDAKQLPLYRVYPRISVKLEVEEPPKFYLNKPLEIEETRYYEFKEVKGGNPANSIKSVADQYAVAFLNSEGGKIFWGVRDADRIVIGVQLTYKQRDEIRRVVTEKLTGIKPSIAPTSYRLELYQVEDEDGIIDDLFIVELTVPRVDTSDLYFSSRDEAFVKTDGGKKKLSGPEIQEEIRKRLRV